MVGLRRRQRAGQVLSSATGGFPKCATSSMTQPSTTTGMDSGCKGLLDTTILVDNPSLCHRLVKKRIMCGSWPRDMNSHLQVAHRSWWEEAGPLAEQCAVSFISRAHPTRWCACQLFHSIGLNEDHCCPCLRQFSICIWCCGHTKRRKPELQHLLDSSTAPSTREASGPTGRQVGPNGSTRSSTDERMKEN